ncbi:MAG: hypothetical protein D6696_01020, partial [Acidobacteria bacterium]
MSGGWRRRAAAAVLLAATAAAAPAQDWPWHRGPHHDGTVAGDALPPPPVALALRWQRPLGSGYAAISIAGGVGVTLFSDGERDHVIAFDAASGEERWRHPIGPTYRGHDGSADGPLSTPAIAGDTVFALGPRGELLALALADGRRRWSRRLVEEGWGRAPQYGFATSPLIAGELVVVQAGGAGARLLVAFDRTSGEVRWTAGEDSSSYQSPVVVELLGRRQLLAVGDHVLVGVEPRRGEVLWQHRHTAEGRARGASGHPLVLDGDRLLVRSGPSEAVLFTLAAGAQGTAIRELWRSRRLFTRSHAAAVPYDGRLYSFDDHFLTCVEPASGETCWKSRPPGGRGLIRIGPYLAILADDGAVVLVEAKAEGYAEAARLKVFARGGWTPPTYAGGAILVRNLEAMARLAIVAARAPAGPAAVPRLEGACGELARRLEAAGEAERRALIDAFLARHPRSPLVEDGGLVCFLYRGPAQDVALSGNLTAAVRQELPLMPVAGGGLFLLTRRLDEESLYEYRFHVDFAAPVADPRNPDRVGSIFGPSSVLAMPRWQPPLRLATPAATTRGRVEELRLPSTALGAEQRLRIYLPPGFDAAAGYPLVVVQESAGAAEARLPQLFDELIGGGRAAAAVVALLPPLAREHDAPALDAYARMVAEELVPALERRFGARRDGRVLLGAGSGAPIAAWIAFARPGVFARLGLHSFFLHGLYGPLAGGAFSLSPAAQDELLARASRRPPQALEIELASSRHPARD